MTSQSRIASLARPSTRSGSALIDSATHITIARNLWINNQSRNPKGKGNLQYINNVIYNWGGDGYVGGHSSAVWHQDLINNCLVKGPSSSDRFLSQFSNTDYVYQAGNVVDLDRDGVLGGRTVVEADFQAYNSPSGTPTFQSSPYNSPDAPVTVISAAKAYEQALAGAGASLHRDSVDSRLIEQLRRWGRREPSSPMRRSSAAPGRWPPAPRPPTPTATACRMNGS